MNLNLLQSLLMGFTAGFSAPLPVSGGANQGLLRYFFGVESEGALFELACHVAILVVILLCGRTELSRLHRANKMLKTPPRRRLQQPDLNSVNTIKLLRTAGLFAVVGGLVRLDFVADTLYLLGAVLILNGIVLWLPRTMRTGNKDARNLVRADGILMGLGAALSVIPGFSPVGGCMSAAAARGADRRYALRFAYLLLIISLGAGIVGDVAAAVGAGFDFGVMELLSAAAGAACAAFGSYLAIQIMHSLVRVRGIHGFCYYSWGQALLCFILFLFV